MSFLAPWFLLGLCAVAIPILLHLQRRRTQKELPWSSLRFLRAAPPRFERRRRIEHWLLLLVRALVVVLLAGAFARPLFTRAVPAVVAAGGARRLLLVDTSASMQRSGLWAAALARVRDHIAAAAPGDRLALMTYSDRATLALGFEDWAAAAPAARAALAEARLAAIAPGSGGTDLGAALVAAAEVVADDAGQARASDERVILVSDLAEGARLTALGPREWPAGLGLRLERLAGGARINLGLHAVPDAAGEEERVRVRVVASRGEGAALTARVGWAEGAAVPVEIRLAPGESRVVEAPVRGRGAGPGTLWLEGDGDDFDNRLAVAPLAPLPSAIVYVGEDDGKDAAGSFYFLSRAFPKTRARAAEVVAHRPGDPGLPAAIARADLVVLTGVSEGVLAPLRRYLAAGRTLVFVALDAAGAGALAALTGGAVPAWSEAAGREAVLTAVDVGHPLLQAFADRGAADFTRVRFWHHRVLDLGALPARVLARFDDGGVAWALVPVGRGQIFVMSAGWQPHDSQLGLSSKLVPLLFGLLDASAGAAAEIGPRFVGDPLPVPRGTTEVVRPDGARVRLAAGAQSYLDTDRAGLYRLTGETDRWVAVNLPPAESATAPLPLEALERAGIPVGEGAAGVPAGAGRSPGRTEFLAGLEAEQKPWRWALLAVLLLALAESLLTLRAARPAARGAA